MTTDTPADPSVFEDTDRESINITEDEFLGTHTYPGMLYTGDTEIVNVLTGETPADLDRSVNEAKEFAADSQREGKAPRVAKRVPGEQAVESRSPYVSSVFYHMSMTGGYDWHMLFHRAWESDAYEITHHADYETGDLTITVERVTP